MAETRGSELASLHIERSVAFFEAPGFTRIAAFPTLAMVSRGDVTFASQIRPPPLQPLLQSQPHRPP